MRPCEPTGDVSSRLPPLAEIFFPDSLEVSDRPAVIFRGVRPDGVVRTDAGVPGLVGGPYRFSRKGRPPAAG